MSGSMVAKAEKSGGGGEAASSHQSRWRRSFSKPSWLLCTIADLDEKMKSLTGRPPRENGSDSFAARANSYYHERPQLLALLRELYNGYLSLADRYCQALAKNNHKRHRSSGCASPVPPLTPQLDEGDDGVVSDAESALSFQPPAHGIDADVVVAELVVKTVECDIVLDELAAVEKRGIESSRKMELQKNLLDVLESERLILLNDNAGLGYRVAALEEENRGLASETLFLNRKAAELARCVLKTREDHRVCVLSRKIEDLQEQIHGLEKRNREYYERLKKQEEKNRSPTGRKSCKAGGEVHLEGVSLNVQNARDQHALGKVEDGRASKLWDKVKKFDLFVCGPHFNATSSCGKMEDTILTSW